MLIREQIGSLEGFPETTLLLSWKDITERKCSRTVQKKGERNSIKTGKRRDTKEKEKDEGEKKKRNISSCHVSRQDCLCCK